MSKIKVYQFDWDAETCPCDITSPNLPEGFEIDGTKNADGKYTSPPALYITENVEPGDYVIPIVIEACLKNKKFPCSNGKQLRDFVHVDDLVKCILLCFNNKKASQSTTYLY